MIPALPNAWVIRAKRWCDRQTLTLLQRLGLEEMLSECYRDGFAAGRASLADVHMHGDSPR
jgi:hypothetical protein